MKILTAEQLKLTEKQAVEVHGITFTDLMERAGTIAAEWIKENFPNYYRPIILCGQGNNGGDGLVIARKLNEAGYKVRIWVMKLHEKGSVDFEINLKRAQEQKIEIHFSEEAPNTNLVDEHNFIVDALFGYGVSRPADGVACEWIDTINESNCPIISIDLPSGLPADYVENIEEWPRVYATYTLTFHCPKFTFFLPETGVSAGDFTVIDIGLDKHFSDTLPGNFYWINSHFVGNIYKARYKFSHKGTYGNALIMGGSKGKPGAAIMATLACLRSGVGLTTLQIPSHYGLAALSQIPEALIEEDENEFYLSVLPKKNYHCIGIGAGLDTQTETKNLLKQIIQDKLSNLVLDADALNILAENKTWLAYLPKGSIITPHPLEFLRLSEKPENSFDRLQKMMEMSHRFGIYIVGKDTHTAVVSPSGQVYFNSSGNSGLAKGGSGDVLLGLITGLRAQGYSPFEASVMGVYLHGKAADLALENQTMESMLPRDVIDHIGKAFKTIQS
jgi:NAD(P)H-hydrate epimerase